MLGIGTAMIAGICVRRTLHRGDCVLTKEALLIIIHMLAKLGRVLRLLAWLLAICSRLRLGESLCLGVDLCLSGVWVLLLLLLWVSGGEVGGGCLWTSSVISGGRLGLCCGCGALLGSTSDHVVGLVVYAGVVAVLHLLLEELLL